MTTPTPTGGQSPAPKEDFLTKHWKSLVAVICSLLIGDALPTIIQNAQEPDKFFYTIGLMTLPYTGALVLIFLLWAKIADTNFVNPHEASRWGLLGTALILGAGFALGYYTHWWGFSDWNLNHIHPWFNFCTDSSSSMRTSCKSRGGVILLLLQVILLFIQFYVTVYGLPMFIAATLASCVITWNILKWMKK